MLLSTPAEFSPTARLHPELVASQSHGTYRDKKTFWLTFTPSLRGNWIDAARTSKYTPIPSLTELLIGQHINNYKEKILSRYMKIHFSLRKSLRSHWRREGQTESTVQDSIRFHASCRWLGLEEWTWNVNFPFHLPHKHGSFWEWGETGIKSDNLPAATMLQETILYTKISSKKKQSFFFLRTCAVKVIYVL